MKYRLKKELPGMPAGREFDDSGSGFISLHTTLNAPHFPDWFEPVTEPAHSFKVGDWVMFDGHKWQVTSIVEPYTLERYVGDRHEQAYVMPEDIAPVKTAPAVGGNTAKIPHATNISPGDTVTWQGHTGEFLGFDKEDACFSVNYAPYVIRANPWELEKVTGEEEKENGHTFKVGDIVQYIGKLWMVTICGAKGNLELTTFDGPEIIHSYPHYSSVSKPDSRQDEEENNTPQERAETPDSLLDSPAFKEAVRRIIREELP